MLSNEDVNQIRTEPDLCLFCTGVELTMVDVVGTNSLWATIKGHPNSCALHTLSRRSVGPMQAVSIYRTAFCQPSKSTHSLSVDL